KANFEKMAYFNKQDNFYIEDLIQKTFLEVNEEGIEAGAVTVAHVRGGSSPPPDEFLMVVDKPFFIIIRDNRYGLVLFMGAIYDPIMIS
ncbi:MAG: serpin family protein, partial [Candidatus Krumholzibacteria bacterium]|nr:serpin family protein [Candidatus Krumholzibacteria bacterium]